MNLVVAMRALIPARHLKPSPRKSPLLSMRPSLEASWLELARRLLLLAVSIAFCAVLGSESLSIVRRMSHEAELSQYRAALYNVSTSLRAMRTRAITRHRPFEMRIDEEKGSFTVSSLSHEASGYTALESAIWLPEGLQISEAPLWITAHTNGTLTPATIVVAAPALRRLFRITIQLHGAVELHEEQTS